ncbi:MAG: glycoside hydrolase family 2 protein [Anaerolineae bacterium]
MINIPRPEYPRPQFVRQEWLNLNGPWGFAFDDDDIGLQAGWSEPEHHLTGEIVVPFPFEARASGIGDTAPHRVVWYRREFAVPAEWAGRRVRLHFGAVDYETMVWVNGQLQGVHRGGYTAFAFDITATLRPGLNTVTVRVLDELIPDQPRGKQALTPQSYGIWYTRCTGIWRTVWLEPVADGCLEEWQIEPDWERGEVDIRVRTQRWETLALQVQVHGAGRLVAEASAWVHGARGRVRLALDPWRPWSPDDPQLYDLSLTLRHPGSEAVLDRVEGYFGLRRVGIRDGWVTINGEPYYQKLALDQSYWADGLYTAPSDDANRGDVEWLRRPGFNGVRKHQVSSDPRFLYWADRLGLLVWQDMPGQTVSIKGLPDTRVRGQAEANLLREWAELMRECLGHPSIIAWVPFNETWGIGGISRDAATRAYLQDVVRLTRNLDPTRLVVDNDGWEHGEETDILAIHDYATTGAELREHLAAWVRPGWERTAQRYPLAILPGSRYLGQPLALSEYGGIGLVPEGHGVPENRWGYGNLEPNEAAFLARYRGLQEALAAEPRVTGYCYTQLTDTEQEVNGLLTVHRAPKVDPAAVKALNDLVGPSAAWLAPAESVLKPY